MWNTGPSHGTVSKLMLEDPFLWSFSRNRCSPDFSPCKITQSCFHHLRSCRTLRNYAAILEHDIMIRILHRL